MGQALPSPVRWGLPHLRTALDLPQPPHSQIQWTETPTADESVSSPSFPGFPAQADSP